MVNEIFVRADCSQGECRRQSFGAILGGRFGCQALLSEKSILAAMAYVDLNPVRAIPGFLRGFLRSWAQITRKRFYMLRNEHGLAAFAENCTFY